MWIWISGWILILIWILMLIVIWFWLDFDSDWMLRWYLIWFDLMLIWILNSIGLILLQLHHLINHIPRIIEFHSPALALLFCITLLWFGFAFVLPSVSCIITFSHYRIVPQYTVGNKSKSNSHFNFHFHFHFHLYYIFIYIFISHIYWAYLTSITVQVQYHWTKGYRFTIWQRSRCHRRVKRKSEKWI